MRPTVIIILFMVLSPTCLAQEFEITLPEDLEPGTKRARAAMSKRVESKKPQKPTLEKKLADAELYMFHQTGESKSKLERVEALEQLLYGASGSGDVNNRVDKICATISSGNLDIEEKRSKQVVAVNTEEKKWWHFFKVKKKPKPTRSESLLVDGRKNFDRKNWQQAYDAFAQILMLQPNNLEALFKSAACEYYIYTDPARDTSTRFNQEKLNVARSKLLKAKRLYVLSKNTEQALQVDKVLEAIDAKLKASFGPLEDEF